MMASMEQKYLAQYIKDVHLALRKSTHTVGVEKAWQNHCGSEETLTKYAEFMEKLATTYWENNCNSEISEATSRIKWIVDFCYEYFINSGFLKSSEREIVIAEKIMKEINNKESFSTPFKLLDVGSCYNPFKTYKIFDVFAIDLCPANCTVWKCDFLNVPIGKKNAVHELTVMELEENGFDIITFCFLLEYMPSSELRISACEKAYKLLKPGGLLLITTPDSKHVGANSRIMKCWRYTLALIGFNRIKYEKLKYMHCMAFRKSLHRDISVRWANLYKEPYMDYSINIPQDFNNSKEESSLFIDKDSIANDFQELPFKNSNIFL